LEAREGARYGSETHRKDSAGNGIDGSEVRHAYEVLFPAQSPRLDGGLLLIRGSGITERKTGIATLDQHTPCEGWSLTFFTRDHNLRVFYALHQRYQQGDYETWKYITPIQKAAWSHRTFEYGTWGGEVRSEFKPQAGEIGALEHWCSSGFANPDLDLQLKKHGIQKVIVMGLTSPGLMLVSAISPVTW